MKKTFLLVIGLAALVVMNTQASQEQLAKSIGEARAEAQKTSEQLKATLASLNALTKQTKGDLKPAYNTFTAEVANTQTAAQWTGARVQWMATDGRQYFKTWQETIDGIANASLKKKAQKRLDTVQASYTKVETSLKEAEAKFKPFLSDLSDVQKALAVDVTPGGVAAAKPVVKSANWNHQYVNKAIDAALKEMDKMEKSLSSQAK
jgi:hypothetical protein